MGNSLNHFITLAEVGSSDAACRVLAKPVDELR